MPGGEQSQGKARVPFGTALSLRNEEAGKHSRFSACFFRRQADADATWYFGTGEKLLRKVGGGERIRMQCGGERRGRGRGTGLMWCQEWSGVVRSSGLNLLGTLEALH